jgi:ketosteroid isomerase-like protein
MIRTALTLVLLSFAFGAAAQDLPSVALPAPLERVLRDYEREWEGKNPAGLAALFAEDGYVMSNGKPAVRGRDAIKAGYANAGGPLALRALSYATDGDVGYIIGAYGGRDDKGDTGKFILALKRDPSGRWLIAADIDNVNRRPKPPAPPNPPTAPAPPAPPSPPTAP